MKQKHFPYPSLDCLSPSPNGKNQKLERFKKQLTDGLIITAVIMLVGGFFCGLTWMFLDVAGPECLVIHCVKIIR